MKGFILTLVSSCWLVIIIVRGQIQGWSLPNVPNSPNAARSTSLVGGRDQVDRATSTLLGAVSRGQLQQQPAHQQFWTDQAGTQDTISVVGGGQLEFGNAPHQGQSVIGSVHIRDQQSRAPQRVLPQDQFIIHAPSVISLQSLAPDWNLDWWYQSESNIAPSLDQRLPELTQQTSSSQHGVEPYSPTLQLSVGQPLQQQSAVSSQFQLSQSGIIINSPPQTPSQPLPPQPPSQPLPPQPPSQSLPPPPPVPPLPPQPPSEPMPPQIPSQPLPQQPPSVPMPPQPPSQPLLPPPPSLPIPPQPPSHPVPPPLHSHLVHPPFHAQITLHTSDLSQQVPQSSMVHTLQTSNIQLHPPLVSSVQQQQAWVRPKTISENSSKQSQIWTHPVIPQASVSWTEDTLVQEPLSTAWEDGTQHISSPISSQTNQVLPVNSPPQANIGPPSIPSQLFPTLPLNPPTKADIGPSHLPPQTLPALPINPSSHANMGLPPSGAAGMLTQTSHVVSDNQPKGPANYVLLGQPDGGNRTSFRPNSLPTTGGEIPLFTGQYQQLPSQSLPSPQSAIPSAISPPASVPLTQFANEAESPSVAAPLPERVTERISPSVNVKQDAILKAETPAQSVPGREIMQDNSQLPAGTRMPPVNLGQPSNSHSQINFLHTTPSQVGFLPSSNIFPQTSWDAAWEHYYEPAQFSNSGTHNQGNSWGQHASQSVPNQFISQGQLHHRPSAITQLTTSDQSNTLEQQSLLVQEQSLSQQMTGQQTSSSSQWNSQPPSLSQHQTDSANQSPSEPQTVPQQTSWQQTPQQLSQQSNWQTQPQPQPPPEQQLIHQQPQWQLQPVQPQLTQQQSAWHHGQPHQPLEQHGLQQQHWQQPQPAQQERPADIGAVQGHGWAAVINSRPALLQYGVTLVDGTSYTEEYSLPMSRVQQIVVKDLFDRVVTSLTIDRNSGTFSLRSKRGINLCYVGMIDQGVLDNMNVISDSIRTSTHSYIHQINELFVYREAEQLFPRDVRAVAGDFLARTCGHEPIIFRIVKAQNSVIINGNLTLPGETCPFGPPLRSGFNLYGCGSSGYCPLLYACNMQHGLCCPEMPRSTNCISLSIGQICVTYMPNRPIID